MDIDLVRLAGDSELCSILGWPFDFRVVKEQPPETWYSIEGAGSPRVIGRGSTGGDYVLLPASGRVLFASPERAAGIVAAGAMEFFSLIVELPYWQGLLKFSGGGQLEEMRRAAPELEEMALGSEPGLDVLRDIVRSKLNLAIAGDPVGRLHRAVTASDAVVIDQYGQPAGPLFGCRTVNGLIQVKVANLPWMPFA